MPPRAIVDIIGRRSIRSSLVGVVLAVTLLTACSDARSVTINSECDTDVLVDWLYRSQGGDDVIQGDTTIEAGEHVYSDAVETEYIALLNNGEVVAETSLAADQLDADGANPFPAMVIPADTCDQLTPASATGSADDGS